MIAAASGCGGGETQTYKVPSEAMLPTLEIGQVVTVDRDAYTSSAPQINDIVVFHPPEGAVSGGACGVQPSPGQACPEPTASEASDILFIKRVVAGPGDRVSIKDGAPVVNGKTAEEGFAKPCHGSICELPRPMAVPSGQYFMLGDNRAASEDSRSWGPVPESWIVGRVTP